MSVDTYRDPPLYTIEDLDNEKQKTQFYAEQLRLAPNPENLAFEIEEVLDEKISKEDGKSRILVKYLFYPRKFNIFLNYLS